MAWQRYGQAVAYWQQVLAREPGNQAARHALAQAPKAYDSQEASSLSRGWKITWTRRQILRVAAAAAGLVLVLGLIFGAASYWGQFRERRWISARLERARQDHAAGRLESARRIYKKILARAPGHQRAMKGLERLRRAKMAQPTPSGVAKTVMSASALRASLESGATITRSQAPSR